MLHDNTLVAYVLKKDVLTRREFCFVGESFLPSVHALLIPVVALSRWHGLVNTSTIAS